MSRSSKRGSRRWRPGPPRRSALAPSRRWTGFSTCPPVFPPNRPAGCCQRDETRLRNWHCFRSHGKVCFTWNRAEPMPPAGYWSGGAISRRKSEEKDDKEIGRASCRERVCQYVKMLVVDVAIKKKQK